MKNISFKNMVCFCETDETDSKTENPELHINIWEIKTKFLSKKSSLLDIGFKFNIENNTKKLILVFPWKIESKDLLDLSSKFETNNALRAVFNENYSCTHKTQEGGYVVKENTKTLFNIIEILVNNIEIKNHTINLCNQKKEIFSSLEFDISDLKRISQDIDNTSSYFYFRLRISNIPDIFYKSKISYFKQLITGASTLLQLIDFRVNVRRDIPDEIFKETKYRPNDLLEFKKIHLFLMKPKKEKITFENKYFIACRSLENETYWAEYSGHRRKIIKQSLGYQWTEKIKTDNNTKRYDGLTILARFESLKFNLWVYAFAILFLGFLSGLSTNYFLNWITDDTKIEMQLKDTDLSPNLEGMTEKK